MPEQLTPGSSEYWLKHLGARLDRRRNDLPSMATFADYYYGRHPLSFATEKFRNTFGNKFGVLADNMCAVVVDTLAERMEVQGFRLGSDDLAGDSEAWRIWQANNLDAEMTRGFRESFIKGEVSVIIWRGDDERTPSITLHDPLEVVVELEGRRRVVAMRRWYDAMFDSVCANLYYPDRIEKYIVSARTQMFSGHSVWEPRQVPDEPWPLRNPLGEVPVVSLPNRPSLHGVGESEIAQVIGLQNSLNKFLLDSIVASERVALPQRYATNLDIPADPITGEPVSPFREGEDTLWTAPPPARDGEPPTQFGQFPQVNFSNHIEMMKTCIQHIATATRMPPHYLLGDPGQWPSGESLKAAEAGLVYKAKERQRDFADPIEDVMRLAFKVIGDDVRAAATASEVIWRDPEMRSESAHMDALSKLKSFGIPNEILWEQVPFSPTQIERIKTVALQRDIELSAQQAEVLASLIKAGFTPEAAARAAGAIDMEHGGGIPASLLANTVNNGG